MNERSLTYRAPAKINLHLRVAGPDASGFHPLRSWMVSIDLADTITGTLASPASERITLVIDGQPDLPADRTNLVYRAAAVLSPDRAIALRLTKRVPMGAGLGGGSADAAATLLLVNDLLEQRRSVDELHAIAATLGSDVPFFLRSPSAIATGRGERLTACPAPRRARYALLVLPSFGVSTPAAYRTLDRLRPTAPADVLDPIDVDAWATLSAAELVSRLENDLEMAAFEIEPRLGRLRTAIEQSVGRPVRMSGSGSTLFTLYDERIDAEQAAESILSGSADGSAGGTSAERRLRAWVTTLGISPIGRA